MLKVQEFLKNNSLIDLYKKYGVEHKKKNGKVSLHYNIYKSPKCEEICKECCGLILRDSSWDIVSYPFNRIFNYRDECCSKLNFSQSTFNRTMGGVLVQAYYDPLMNEWCIGSKKTPEGNDLCGKLYLNYKMLALMAFKKVGKPFVELQKKMDTALTYIFELVTPYTKSYISKDINIVLIGVRDLITLKELSPMYGNTSLGLSLPIEYKFYSILKVIEFISKNLNVNSGLVVKSIKPNNLSFDRTLFKSIFDIRNIIVNIKSDEDILRVIILGQLDEVFPYVNKELQKRVLIIQNAFIKLINKTDREWDDIKNIKSSKEFSIAATSKPFSAAMFYMKRHSEYSVSDFLYRYCMLHSNFLRVFKMIQNDI